MLLTKTSFHTTYQGTFLGMTWSLFAPFIQVIIYAVVFSIILRFAVENYALYLVCGLVPWGLILSTLPASAESLISRNSALKHSLMPKTVFPVADTLKAIIITGLSFISMYLPLAIWYDVWRWQVILIPLAALPLVIFCFAWSITIAFIGPYLRDISHLLTIGLQGLFWVTPIIYPPGAINSYKGLSFIYWPITFNPVRYLIEPIQILGYGLDASLWQSLAFGSFIALLSVLICLITFFRLHKRVVFYL